MTFTAITLVKNDLNIFYVSLIHFFFLYYIPKKKKKLNLKKLVLKAALMVSTDKHRFRDCIINYKKKHKYKFNIIKNVYLFYLLDIKKT